LVVIFEALFVVFWDTVDGSEIPCDHQFRLVVYSKITGV